MINKRTHIFFSLNVYSNFGKILVLMCNSMIFVIFVYEAYLYEEMFVKIKIRKLRFTWRQTEFIDIEKVRIIV